MSEELIVTLKSANQLEDADWFPGGGTTDAYAVLSIVVDGQVVDRKNSTTKNNTSNPVWNEVFPFQINQNMIQRGHLNIEVKDGDKTGMGIIDWAITDDPLGQVRIRLSDMINSATGQDLQYKLGNKNASLTLSWQRKSFAPIPGPYPPAPIPGPTPPGAQGKSKLIVTLISAQGLQDADWAPGAGSSDAYATLAVGTAGKALAQPQRSTTKNNTSNPVWNEQFTFEVGQQDISKAVLYIDVKDDDKVGVSLVDWALRDDEVGQVKIPLSHLIHNASGMPAKYPLDDKGALLVISCRFETQVGPGPSPMPQPYYPIPQPFTPCAPIQYVVQQPVVQQPIYYNQPVSYSVVQQPCVRSPSYSTVVRAPSFSAPVVAGPVVRVPSYSTVNRTPSVSVIGAPVGAPAYQAYPAAYTTASAVRLY